MKVKRGASIDNCSQEILLGAIKVEPLFISREVEMVITSGCEEYEHSATHSNHYSNDAIDVRSKTLKTTERKVAMRAALKKKLGPMYNVILESIGKPWEHFHIAWKPIYIATIKDRAKKGNTSA